jgi:predicted GIY-YIG superfamily endonuclease
METKAWLASLPVQGPRNVVYKVQRGNRVYIGSTKHLRHRMQQHMRSGILSRQPGFPAAYTCTVLHGLVNHELGMSAIGSLEAAATRAAQRQCPPVKLLNHKNIQGRPRGRTLYHMIRNK